MNKNAMKETKIPTISQRTKQESQSTNYDSPKKVQPSRSALTNKKLTFKEPCKSEPRHEIARGFRTGKKTKKINHGAMRPAGIPSVQNRFDQDWMKLTKNGRPNSVPSRISRFTSKAPNKWRVGDTSAFEYDKPRIKRSGSRRSAKSENGNIYPDWWGN